MRIRVAPVKAPHGDQGTYFDVTVRVSLSEVLDGTVREKAGERIERAVKGILDEAETHLDQHEKTLHTRMDSVGSGRRRVTTGDRVLLHRHKRLV